MRRQALALLASSILGQRGDGLRRPLNAPPAVPPAPGVQPGSPAVVIANRVIVFGLNGGIFVYSGTPALGNLIASVTGSPTAGPVDPYGNHTWGGLSSYDQSSNSGVSVNGFQLAYLQNTGPGTAWSVTMGIFQALAPGNGIELSGAGFWDFGGVPVLGGIKASAPSDPTGVTPDTWHAAALLNGWANAGGGLAALQYTLLPTDAVHLYGTVTAAGMTGTQLMTLPAGYQPRNTGSDMGGLGFHLAAAAAAGIFLRVATSGAVSLLNSTNASGVIGINNIIPLGSL